MRWQKSYDRHNHCEHCFNPSDTSGLREIPYLFLLTSVILNSFYFLDPFSLEKYSIFYVTSNLFSPVTFSRKESDVDVFCFSQS